MQKPAERSTTAIRITGVLLKARVATVFQVETRTRPMEIETSRIAVNAQSCSRRRSTASNEGVRKSRRPATLASCWIRSVTRSSFFTWTPTGCIGTKLASVERRSSVACVSPNGRFGSQSARLGQVVVHELQQPPPGLDPFASSSRIRELVEQLPVAVYVDDDDRPHRTVYASPNIEKIIGFSAERLVAEPDIWGRSMHPDDRERVREEAERSWIDGTPFRGEYRIIRPDGEVVWVRDSCMLVLSDEGKRLAWQGVIEDITNEKRAAQQMKDSDARYRALVERVPAVVYEMGPDDERRTLYVSRHVESVLGYTREEWLDQPDIWIELLHADDRELVLDRHDRHSRTGEPWDLEYRLIASDGRVVWVHDRGTLIRGLAGRPAAWHGVLIDVTAEHEAREMLRITNEELERRVAERTAALEEANELMSLEIGERRRMETELRDARQRYQRLVEDLPGVAYLWEATRGTGPRSFTYISPQIEGMLGFAPWAWKADLRVHPHDRARVVEAVERSSSTGEPLRIEYRYLADDGRIVWVLDHASLISRTDGGEPLLFQGVMLDITGLKEAESKAADAEDRFRAITERGPVVALTYELRYEAGGWPPAAELTY